ncbi:hypothetical protein K6Q96_06780 [Grimontia kaedaensis]|uniref:Uncharacterized protein n=1 Tax=Grimontia kaedaensis TaxID=2872157 RepID=A0ABY4WXG8_9GAMM|nr:hypothetical protein [Grimontia kaedaensis]USH03692.1 hypothetical protein K6Q96_06780 [Grimontia kaedaensis]
MKYNFLFALCILFSSQAFASEWSSSTKVKEVIAGYKEGIILFSTKSPHHNPKNCPNASYYSVSQSEADLEMVLSILLAAQRSDSEIQVGVDATKCGTISHAEGRMTVTRIKSL